jgi:hypothetical protein
LCQARWSLAFEQGVLQFGGLHHAEF